MAFSESRANIIIVGFIVVSAVTALVNEVKPRINLETPIVNISLEPEKYSPGNAIRHVLSEINKLIIRP